MDRTGYYCTKCNTINNAARNNNNSFKLRHGICPHCGNKMDRQGYCCSKCYAKIKNRMNVLRHERRDQGLCARCGKPSKTYLCKECKKE